MSKVGRRYETSVAECSIPVCLNTCVWREKEGCIQTKVLNIAQRRRSLGAGQFCCSLANLPSSLALLSPCAAAVDHYSKCLKGLSAGGKSQSDLAVKAHSNRAACYKQISNFDGVIEDCTAVLEVEPENVKALVRRAQAFEGVERYRFALQDVKTVLALGFSKVGKQNFDMCNMMQHRLNRTVQQLKAGNC